MSKIIDTVEDRIQNAILTAIVSIVAPKIELTIWSINASSGQDPTSVTANSESGEHVGINVSFENASGKNNVLHVSNVNDETGNNIPDEVSELSVPETRFDWQTHTHQGNQKKIGEERSLELTECEDLRISYKKVKNWMLRVFLGSRLRRLKFFVKTAGFCTFLDS